MSRKAELVIECIQQNINNEGFISWLYDMLFHKMEGEKIILDGKKIIRKK